MNLKNCDIYRFKKIVAHKKLICFGMGKIFHDFLNDFSDMRFEEDIYAIADNKVEKDGEHILLNGISIKIMNPDSLINMQDIVILISCADVIGVYEQLEKYRLSENVDCYIVYFIKSQTSQTDDKNRAYPLSLRITKEQRIPKKIHYCWFGNHSIPDKNIKWMESWKRYCPDYEIIQWNENNYDITKNTYMYEAYKQEKWGFVPDYARLDIIYHHGGIYLDTDVEIVKPFDELLYQKAFAGVETSGIINLGLGFGAEKRHSIIKQLLDQYEDVHFIDEHGKANLTPFGVLQYPFFKSKGFVDNGEYQIVDDLTVYPETVLAPKDFYTGEIRITNHTFSIHHYDASWVGKREYDRIMKVRELFLNIQKENEIT